MRLKKVLLLRAEVEEEIPLLRFESKIVGPMTIWLYAPDFNDLIWRFPALYGTRYQALRWESHRRPRPKKT